MIGLGRAYVEPTRRFVGDQLVVMRFDLRQEITPALDVLVALARDRDARLFDAADPEATNLTTAQAVDLLAPTVPPYVG
ncbi:MAG: hypothetical protein IRY92_02880 [Dactylosporangium sp.]|nr:hypothetical protein [Dactylosporangium sp.]